MEKTLIKNDVGRDLFPVLLDKIHREYGYNAPDKRLNYCAAWYQCYTLDYCGNSVLVWGLQSYGTLAAIAYYNPDTQYIRVGRFCTYSATTSQHVHKFAKMLCEQYSLPRYQYTVMDYDTDGIDRRVYMRGNL